MRKIIFLALLGLILCPSTSFSTTNAARVKSWTAEKLYSADLNTEFDNLVNYLNNNIAFVTNITATAAQINQLANNRFNQASSFVSAVTDSAAHTMNVGFVYTNNGRAIIDSLKADTLYSNSVAAVWTLTPLANSTGRIGSDSKRFQSVNADTVIHTVKFDSNDVKSAGIAGSNLASTLSGAKTWSGTQSFKATVPMVVGSDTIYGGSSARAFVVVDSAGNGDFTTVNPAINYCNATGRRKIYIRNGTYAGFTANVANLNIEGESWKTIIDGTTITDGVKVTAVGVKVSNLSATTDPAGPGNTAVLTTSTADTCIFENIRVRLSDYAGYQIGGKHTIIRGGIITKTATPGIYIAASDCIVEGVTIIGAGTNGIYIENIAAYDNNLITGCQIISSGARGIYIEGLNCDNTVVVGNRVRNSVTANITDSGTSSTLAGNDTD